MFKSPNPVVGLSERKTIRKGVCETWGVRCRPRGRNREFVEVHTLSGDGPFCISCPNVVAREPKKEC